MASSFKYFKEWNASYYAQMWWLRTDTTKLEEQANFILYIIILKYKVIGFSGLMNAHWSPANMTAGVHIIWLHAPLTDFPIDIQLRIRLCYHREISTWNILIFYYILWYRVWRYYVCCGERWISMMTIIREYRINI